MSTSSKPKGRIVKIGTFQADGTPKDWSFDCRGVIPALDFSPSGYPDGTVLIAGYTVDELHQIADQAAEAA